MQKNILLRNFSNYKIGGPASFFLEVKSSKELEKIDFSSKGRSAFGGKKIFILGGGTNALLPDKGFDGLVLLNRIDGIQRKSELVQIGAGVMIDELLNFCIENSFSGLEWAGGLPGTIGAAVRGNAGAFKGEIKDSVFEVESMNLFTKKITKRNNNECEFGYRWSIFKTKPKEFITSVVLKLSKGDLSEIKKLIDEKIEYRNLKHPMDYPNIGSTFKNIPVKKIYEKQKIEFASFIKDDPFPVVLTTKLLALAGLKGKRVGDAQISDKHPNFIVNLGNAKSSEVRKLIKIAREEVRKKWGIDLEEEITYV